MRRIVLLIGGAAVVGAGIAVYALTGGTDAPAPGVVRTSVPLPSISGGTLQGTRYVPPMYHGDVLVVNFWNPYCTPCRSEATLLDLALGRLSRSRLVGDRIAFLGVLFSNANFPHNVPAARRFARDLGERYPTIDDPGGDLADRLDVRGIPTTVIADPDGRVRYEVLGAVKRGQIERLVRRVLRR